MTSMAWNVKMAYRTGTYAFKFIGGRSNTLKFGTKREYILIHFAFACVFMMFSTFHISNVKVHRQYYTT